MTSFKAWLQSLRSVLAPARRPSARRPGVRLGLESLEDRSVPSANQAVPFHETLTVVGVSPTGVISYEGNATHFGHLTAVLNPDYSFTKTAANGDHAFGFVTPATATTGTITITSGTGEFLGATGLADYVITTNPRTGATTVTSDGTLTYNPGADVPTLPFHDTGTVNAYAGMPLIPGNSIGFSATGTGSSLGAYTGTGTFELGSLSISPTGAVSGTFRGSFVFVAANGDRLAIIMGAGFTGTFTGQMSADGTAVTNLNFDAMFTLDTANCTGRFAGATGSFHQIAHADTVSLISTVPGYTAPFEMPWSGEGMIQLSRGH
jgi:hypothetical protein